VRRQARDKISRLEGGDIRRRHLKYTGMSNRFPFDAPFAVVFRRLPPWKVALIVVAALASVAALAIVASVVLIALVPLVLIAVVAHRLFRPRRSSRPPSGGGLIEGVFVEVPDERDRIATRRPPRGGGERPRE